MSLVKTGGGTVLKREPRLETVDQSELTIPYHARPGGQLASCSFYVVSTQTEGGARMQGSRLCYAPIKWLVDSIADFQLLDLPEIS